jgi:hypothetical protein
MSPKPRRDGFSLPAGKVPWQGVILSVQPRIRLSRSFDQRSHSYLGYVLQLRGTMADEARDFIVAVGENAHARHAFAAGDAVSGEGVSVADPRLEVAELYRVSKLRVVQRGLGAAVAAPPWQGIPPELPVYRRRGHRRLHAGTYDTRCFACIWGCRMAVEITTDQWNPSRKQYRFETFCYGPKSCRFYRPGAVRRVPGRKGMTWEEEDWVDEDATSHRGPDE